MEKELSLQLTQNIHEENQLLKASVGYLKAELNKYKELPLLVCDVKKNIHNKAIIRVANGNHFCVNVAANIQLESGDTVLVEQKSLTVVQKLDHTKSFDVDNFLILEKPSVLWESLGGLDEQIKEIKEVVELPLNNPELFKKIGIEPPKGVLLHGAPGTGKTLLAKAVATSTNTTFIPIVASELVQKFIGEGAKLVKDLFQLAKEKAPSIIFIDEIDALASQRMETGTSGEREVQRTLIQLLTEMDGFKNTPNIKVIAATNRIDTLDPAILRPGRFDRIIEFPLPSKEGRKQILSIHTKNMNLSSIDFEELLEKTHSFSGAELKAVCTEAGYYAIRDNRETIFTSDFLKAVEKIQPNINYEENSLEMFG